MTRAIVLLVALVACRDHATPPKSGSATTAPAAPAAPAAPPAADPWAAPAAVDSDDPPTLSERHRRADAACPTPTTPHFYSIVKGNATSYILGTRHIGVPLAKLPPIVGEKLREAHLAIFEIAPDDKGNVKFPDLDLRSELGADDWARYQRLVGKKLAGALEHGRPSTAAISMMAMYEDASAELDNELMTEVRNAKIAARGLETAKFQDELLDKLLDLRALREMVEQTKDRAELAADSADDLHSYCVGDDKQPGMSAKDRAKMKAGGYTDAEIAAIDEELVYARNAKWIPELEPLLDAGGAFIAVGADHLVGKRGVVELLRARGYKVTRVTPPTTKAQP